MSTPFNARTPVTNEEVSSYAYALWEADGRQHGRDQYYWYQAKALLTLSRREESNGQQGKIAVAEAQAPMSVGKVTKEAVAPKSSVSKKTKKRELETVGV